MLRECYRDVRVVARVSQSVAEVLQGCAYFVDAWLILDVLGSIARVLRGCYKGVTMLLQGCYNALTRVLQGCYKGVTRVCLPR
jgi:hypothetical protein